MEEFRMILENIGFTEIVISASYKYDQYPTKANQTITYEAIKE
ncbi:hypothetical protein ACJROX_18910 [Pseudalkalibacillus sp. A8]